MTQDLFARCAPSSLMRLTLAVSLLAMGGCGQPPPEPVTASSSRFQVDDAPATDAVATPQQAPNARTNSHPAVAPGEVPTPPVTPPVTALDDASLGGANGYPVPDDNAALMGFLEKLQHRQPRGATDQELRADYQAIHTARIEAAVKLLAQTSDKKQRVAAMQAKLDGLLALSRLGDPKITKDLNTACREAAADPEPDVAHLGRLMLFGMSLESLASGQLSDAQPLLDELKKLVAEQPDAPGVFMITRQAAMLLQQRGHKDAAAEAYVTIGNAYKDSPDKQIAAEVRAMLEQASIQSLESELDLDRKLQAMLSDQPDSAPPVLDALTKLLAAGTPGEYVLNVAAQIAQLLEISGNYALAGQAFELLEKTFQNHADADLANQATARADNGRRRVGLIGQPFTVTGVRADGEAFDWGAYQGKIVLIDFWATWCQPCLQEIPNIKAAYDKYKAQGFEVVGVNLDDDRQTVVRFLDVQPLPWATVTSADPQAQGFENPLAVQCGIDAIPFLVLVDRQGKVCALHTRGEKLDQKLAELLKPAG